MRRQSPSRSYSRMSSGTRKPACSTASPKTRPSLLFIPLWLFGDIRLILAARRAKGSRPRSLIGGTALQFVPASVNQLSFPCNMADRQPEIFTEANNGNSDDFQAFQEEEPQPRDR